MEKAKLEEIERKKEEEKQKKLNVNDVWDYYLKHEDCNLFNFDYYMDISKYQVKDNQAEQFGKLAVQSIVDAGNQLGLRCPLNGEYKIGNNWKETH